MFRPLLCALSLSLAVSAFAQSADIPEPGSAAAISAATTDPHFVSPLVSYVPQSAGVPSPEKFFGRIMGESLMLFDGSEAGRLADLVGHTEPPSVDQRHELLLDLANIVIGACVNGIAEPLREIVSFAAPAVLVGRPKVCGFALQDSGSGQRGLVINVDFKLEARSFRSRVLVFLAEQSLTLIDGAISRFLDDLAAG